MLFEETLFVGIDPNAGNRPMAYAALDHDLQPLRIDEGDFEDLAAFVAGQESAIVAICGPQRPNQGLMKRDEVRASLNPSPTPGRWESFRLAEYQLYQHNIRIPRTCAQEEQCQGWMRTSFKLYRRCEQIGYRRYPGGQEPLQLLEVYPHGSFSVLLGCLPFKKDTLEGRLQRQLIMHNLGLEIFDPMRIFDQITRYRLMQGDLPLDGLYTSDELDALVGAYTAWFAATRRDDVTVLGDPTEGEIVLPVDKLDPVYK